MALTILQLFSPTQLPTAVAVLYAMPDAASQPTAVLKNGRIRLSNASSTAAVPVTLYAAPAATASGPSNCCFPSQSIAPNSYLDVDIPTLKAGDTLRAVAGTANMVTAHEMGGVLYS
ncbi:hypothetical protein [Massilia phyllosphaerae]|uniref:hypothetical protein n=1 Tax=Massilia phyllosphaerae TaxID=3106034 RepID=UPI002B1CC14A|nr:hypothetical protein [Massilia sp. SGZ-792]